MRNLKSLKIWGEGCKTISMFATARSTHDNAEAIFCRHLIKNYPDTKWTKVSIIKLDNGSFDLKAQGMLSDTDIPINN